jgi:LysM repeat protein
VNPNQQSIVVPLKAYETRPTTVMDSLPTKPVVVKKLSQKYSVKSGDTLSGIAQRHHTTVAKIKSLNALKSDTIRVGQVLKIPK